MNYSCVALVLLLAYLWHAGSLMEEINAIKELLSDTYEMIETKFYTMTREIKHMRNETMFFLNQIHNTTMETIQLVTNNSKKIDEMNTKIDTLISFH
ncbi:gp16 [Cryptophlebia peltastica nucleopolyhedrovirus]|uniref:Gp16 n=1 Tax=Cryptophlebia peltastica nucleopolyhedrovirus TaxID=2304025 RepID=A0A346RNX2_9ABAC|nr:gp16 [Cryptophlebia peltastica nucleopolyhedrovirus]AXS67769.1 gp16 [Cryptophlebia peltastica nucleopolyhedrovirus]